MGMDSEKGKGEMDSEKGKGEMDSEKGEGEMDSEKGKGGMDSEKGKGEMDSEKGEGGMDSPKGGAKPRRKVLRDNVQGITKPAIRDYARRDFDEFLLFCGIFIVSLLPCLPYFAYICGFRLF